MLAEKTEAESAHDGAYLIRVRIHSNSSLTSQGVSWLVRRKLEFELLEEVGEQEKCFHLSQLNTHTITTTCQGTNENKQLFDNQERRYRTEVGV